MLRVHDTGALKCFLVDTVRQVALHVCRLDDLEVLRLAPTTHRTLAFQDLKCGLILAPSRAIHRGVGRGENHVALRDLFGVLLV